MLDDALDCGENRRSRLPSIRRHFITTPETRPLIFRMLLLQAAGASIARLSKTKIIIPKTKTN